jgi:hypothetical protein
MKNLLILIMAIIFSSCTTNSNTSNPTNTAIYNHIDVFLKDGNGNDILGSTIYPENNIYANYLINGKIVQVVSNTNKLTYPNNVNVVNERGMHFTRIFLNLAPSEELPITYLHWNATETDILKAQYRRGTGIDGNYVVLEKLWYNDKLVWDVTVEGQTTSAITIVK